MLFVKRTTPTVVVEDNSAARAEAEMLAEERGRASGTVAALGILALVVLVALVGYFAWWAPVNAAEANQNQPPQVIHDTQVVEKPVPSGPTTIVNNPPIVQAPAPPQPRTETRIIPGPTVIHENHYIPVPNTSSSGTNNNNSNDTGDQNNGTTSGDTGG